MVVQYLDDILFVRYDPGEVATVTDSAARLLRQAGFLISEKSVFTPQRSLRWMGKDVDLAGCRVAPAASAVAAVVAAWVKLALRPYTYVALRRLLGKIGWLGRPGNLGGCFLAGARSWLRWGPRWAWRTPAAVVRGLCEAIAQCYRGWEPDTTAGGPAVRVFVDAARCALTTGNDPSYCVGSWGPGGADLSLCPAWVTTQQAAELWGTLVALDDAQARRARRLVLVEDNMGALAQLLWGRAGRQGPAAAHTAEDSPPPPLDGAAADPLLGTVRTKSSGLHQPSMGREGGQGSSDRGGGKRAPVGELAAILAHANCTLFCAPNAQKRTGSQQGKKTIFLDVS